MSDRKTSRLAQIQDMFLKVGNHVRFFLKTVTLAYEQNYIFYSVIQLHEKIMKLIAPPYSLLGVDISQSSQEEQLLQFQVGQNIENTSYSRMKQKIQLNLAKATEVPQMPIISKIINSKQFDGQNISKLLSKDNKFNNLKTQRQRIKKKKQLKDSYYFNKPTIKTQREILDQTQIYNFNKISQKKLKQKQQLKNKVQGNRQNKSRRGRKVEDWDLQCKVYQWVKDEMGKGKRIRKIDIRSQFKKLSGGKFIGSRGWCRRFIGRHPEVNTWFKQSQQNPADHLMSPIREENIDQQKKWYRPDQQEDQQLSDQFDSSQIQDQDKDQFHCITIAKV